MRGFGKGLNTGLKILQSFALGCFVLASLHAAPQTAPEAKEQTKEQLERLIYSVKGQDLFRAHCAACHGSDAKGGGPLASTLRTEAPDLTLLAKKSGGSFRPHACARPLREMTFWRPMALGKCRSGDPSFIRSRQIRILEMSDCRIW
jgi:hypothetical protein